MFSYYTYGLYIKSVLPLPELVPVETDSPTDVVIGLDKIELRESNIAQRNHFATPDVMILYYEGVGTIRIQNGREIVVDPLPGADHGLLRTCLLGPGLAAILHQRGRLILHASAILLGGKAIAFVGDKGFGKSTLAAYLHGRRHTLLSDDIVAVDTNGSFEMWPGFPQLKLWPSALAFLGIDMENMAKVQPNLEKRVHNIHFDFSTNPVPLGEIYILDLGEKIEIVPLKPQLAFKELLRHSYMHRFLEATETAALHFRQCSNLAGSVPVSYLKRPASLAMLPQIAELLEQGIAEPALQ